VVPVSIGGTRRVMQKGRLTVCPAEVTLTVHRPVPTAGLSRDDVLVFAERVRTAVKSAV
jgi:hypothetical protein